MTVNEFVKANLLERGNTATPLAGRRRIGLHPTNAGTYPDEQIDQARAFEPGKSDWNNCRSAGRGNSELPRRCWSRGAASSPDRWRLQRPPIAPLAP